MKEAEIKGDLYHDSMRRWKNGKKIIVSLTIVQFRCKKIMRMPLFFQFVTVLLLSIYNDCKDVYHDNNR